jgi:hypothetical protein
MAQRIPSPAHTTFEFGNFVYKTQKSPNRAMHVNWITGCQICGSDTRGALEDDRRKNYINLITIVARLLEK